MTNETHEDTTANTSNAGDHETQRLHYASNGGSGNDRGLHTDPDCRYLNAANRVHSCRLDRAPRGTLCDSCEPDRTLEDLQANAKRAIADGGDHA